MARLIDLWRVLDVDARLLSGSRARLEEPVRGTSRRRAAAPWFGDLQAGDLLLVDAAQVGPSVERLVADLVATDLEPTGIVIAGLRGALEGSESELPVLASARPLADLAARATAYLADEASVLAALVADFRLATAERALGDPDPASVSALAAARLRRGVAVSVEGTLVGLVPRPAGRALAARFAAAHARLLSTTGSHAGSRRRAISGLAVIEQQVRPGAAVWLFDDLPLARIDEVLAGALAITLRALLGRAPRAAVRPPTGPVATPPTGVIAQTLLAVARSNGRIAPAARSLGVHRNTVHYRLRIAERDHGLDPRRPEDALRLLKDADG
jgi:hypothetical protein